MPGYLSFRHRHLLCTHLQRGPLEGHRKLNIEDIQKIVPPQANGKLTKKVLKDYNLSLDKIYLNLKKVGNTSSASLPIALDEMNRNKYINKGDLVFLLAAEASKWLYGAVALKWGI